MAREAASDDSTETRNFALHYSGGPESERVEALFEQIESAHAQVSEVATTLPELRSALEDASESDED